MASKPDGEEKAVKEKFSMKRKFWKQDEPTETTIPVFTLSVGKYTNSYKYHLGPEFGVDGYKWRIARGQIDDTCFDYGKKVFYSVEDAIRGIQESLKSGKIDFAIEICDGLLYGLTMDWEEFDRKS